MERNWLLGYRQKSMQFVFFSSILFLALNLVWSHIKPLCIIFPTDVCDNLIIETGILGWIWSNKRCPWSESPWPVNQISKHSRHLRINTFSTTHIVRNNPDVWTVKIDLGPICQQNLHNRGNVRKGKLGPLSKCFHSMVFTSRVNYNVAEEKQSVQLIFVC